MNGALAQMTADLDADKLELTMSVKGDVKALPAYKGIDSGLFWARGERGSGCRGRLRIC